VPSPLDVPTVVPEPSTTAHRLDGARHERLASSLRDARWAVAIVPTHAASRSAVAELVARLHGPSGELLRIVEVNEAADRDGIPPCDRARPDS
jgi:hypothetical protein